MEKLSNLEFKIMEIVWNSDCISMAELLVLIPTSSQNSLSNTLSKLRKKGFLTVKSVDSANRNSFLYSALISYPEYVYGKLNKDRKLDVLQYLIEQCTDEELKLLKNK